MAVITSIKSGNLSDPTVWSGGVVPIRSDDVVIAAGTVVTLDQNFVIAASFTINGTLYIGTTYFLSVGGITSVSDFSDGILTLGPGSLLDGPAGAKWHTRAGKVLSTATAADWATVHITPVTFSDLDGRVFWDLRYVKFPYEEGVTGPATLTFLTAGRDPGSPDVAGGNKPTLHFRNCTFGNPTVRFGRAGWTRPNTDIAIIDCDFRDCNTAAVSITTAAPNADETVNPKIIQGNTYYANAKWMNVQWNISNYVVYKITDNIMINARKDQALAAVAIEFERCFFSTDFSGLSEPALIVHSANDASSMENCYYYVPNEAPMNNNAHVAGCKSITNGIFEVYGDEPNVVLGGSVAKIHTSNCIHIGTGDLVNSLRISAYDWDVYNNTRVITDFAGWLAGPVVNTICMDETNRYVPLTTGMVVRNNLQYCATQCATYLCRSARNSGDDFVVDADYNCQYNIGGLMGSRVTNASGGAHNFVADPQFVDPTRTFESWTRAVTGSSSAGFRDGFSLLLLRNGYDAASKTQKAANIPAKGFDDLVAWVKAGYVPRNAALAEAGENGWYIGALPVGGEPVTEGWQPLTWRAL